ncbi:aminoglycoside phosphotransferase family protein [Mycoplasmatota bacterium]|nr:aminoglycoside phosphotransferase family protein [Mycoplasmatota bacterium]
MGGLFQSIEAFKDLINTIFKNEHLSTPKTITNLTPGTNAVFRVDDYVIKLFAPKESGFITERDYKVELESLIWAKKCGVNCPTIVTTNVISDKYIFRYIIMEYIDGYEIGNKLKDYSEEKQILLAKEIRSITKKLNQIVDKSLFKKDIVHTVLHNKKWDKYQNRVKQQIFDHVQKLDFNNQVFVHGDLTKENVLINHDNQLVVIDFADSLLAPYYYEYSPILFDLFDFNPILIKSLFKDVNPSTVDDIFNSLLVHEYGADFIHLIYKRCYQSINQINDIKEIKSIIENMILS